ncbi:hypothetical protein GCM10012288_05270 [Malaciobacter pacificus]|uniref:Uncharacterized protein n=1 Tax=Malaciobacter pacificus TaxID=1080223 RepID=A0A5C2HAC8_9BACT|nr:DUF3800 domain-containing protein [Malaciobacter pacificus]QEP34475.1 hypothetical protein APAC_1361 [Malaciobacter pacificus]GGD34235.1 hypothetical protein GCM10012288_05270 [Malaciobacter pacificus]
MSKEKIKIIQNILKKENRYDIAILLENAYFEDYIIDGWNGGIGEVNIFVHPNNYLQLSRLEENEKSILIKLFDGLPHEYYEINSLTFSINTDIAIEHVNDAVYIFVDEAGDMDFSSNGSKYYMFNFLIKNRPFNLHEIIANYRYSLLERNLDPLSGKRLDIEAFHACEDNKYIRDEMFNLISTFDKNSVKSYSYILEKPKVDPSKRDEKDKFYVDNLNFAIHKLLDELEIQKDFIIITDRLPVHKNKNRQVAALKKGIKEYIKTKKLNIRYDIFHHCSASSVNLQIVDYISWAIFRKYERDEDIFYKKIEKYLIKIDEMTKGRKILHYEK